MCPECGNSSPSLDGIADCASSWTERTYRRFEVVDHEGNAPQSGIGWPRHRGCRTNDFEKCVAEPVEALERGLTKDVGVPSPAEIEPEQLRSPLKPRQVTGGHNEVIDRSSAVGMLRRSSRSWSDMAHLEAVKSRVRWIWVSNSDAGVRSIISWRDHHTAELN